MWYLKSEHDGSLFYLLAGKTYTVNRKEGDLILANDQSISRSHGAICITNEGEVFLWDEGSKYGTFVFKGGSEQKLKPHERTIIKAGDKLRFGLQWNAFVLSKVYFVVCSSSITVEEKRLLKSLLTKIGGSFSNDWNDDCTHLAMNQVSLTHKVVLTLAAGKPITTVQYWEKMVDAICNQLALPKVEDYLPPVGEEELKRQTSSDTLLPSENRKSLFQGKVFVFSSENTKNKIKPLVECAGGVSRSVETSNLPPKVCCEPNYIVVKESEACKQIMPDIFVALKRKGLRTISVSEIGLAIYNDSLTRYCNPLWRKLVILGGSPSRSQGVCLVENTEDIPLNTQDIKVEPREDIVIPPSLGSVVSDTTMDSSRPLKRPLSTSPVDNPPSKRQLQQKETASTSGTHHQWLHRSGSSSTKESEDTCSLDVSRGDQFDRKSQKTQSDESAASKSSKNQTELFKIPSPKKSSWAKRGRMSDDDDDDMFKIPSPKRALTAGKAKKTSKLPSPIKVVESEDKLDETIEDDSDDEFQLPSRKKSRPGRIEDDDLEFQPFSSEKISRRTNGDARNAVEKMKRAQDDELSSWTSEETRKTAPAAATKVVSRVEARTTVARVETTTTDPRLVTRIETSTTSTTDSTGSNSRGNTSHAPSFAEFLDKSTGVPIKKEEENDDKIDEEIIKINFEIEELSLYRKRPPLGNISTNSVISGRPNFKKFRKSRPRIERTWIDLVVDADASIFDSIPDPDAPLANGYSRHENEVTESQDLQSVFPLTNERNRPSRQSRLRRSDSDIDDDWTVS